MLLAELIVSRWGKVIMEGLSGKRYVFTVNSRIQQIDERDVSLFENKRVRISSCGCSGGKREGDYVYMFNVVNEEV